MTNRCLTVLGTSLKKILIGIGSILGGLVIIAAGIVVFWFSLGSTTTRTSIDDDIAYVGGMMVLFGVICVAAGFILFREACCCCCHCSHPSGDMIVLSTDNMVMYEMSDSTKDKKNDNATSSNQTPSGEAPPAQTPSGDSSLPAYSEATMTKEVQTCEDPACTSAVADPVYTTSAMPDPTQDMTVVV